MEKPEGITMERVPRADRLNLLRDVLNSLIELGGVSGKKRLLYETKRKTQVSEAFFSQESTFEDYLMTGQELNLVEIREHAVRITPKGLEFSKVWKFGSPDLLGAEKSFLRALLLEYQPFQTFISIGFLGGESFSNVRQLFLNNNCPKRKDLLRSYMETKGHCTDREEG